MVGERSGRSCSEHGQAQATDLAVEARQRNQEQLARLGREVRLARQRRGLTQTELGTAVGLARPTISALERGLGGGHTMDTWQRVALALGRPLGVTLARDLLAEPADAGHLRIQELVLRIARGSSISRTFELSTHPAEPWRSADVGLRDERRRRLILVECWNTIGDVGASVRATNRKLAEARQYAVAVGGVDPYRVHALWVVRATAANRAILARYPEVFAVRFPGSSARWCRALSSIGEPPAELGLVWCDVGATRVYPWRRRGTPPA